MAVGMCFQAFQSVKGGVGVQAYATDCGFSFFEPPRRPTKVPLVTESGNKWVMRPEVCCQSRGGGAIGCACQLQDCCTGRVKIFVGICGTISWNFANRAVGAFIGPEDHHSAPNAGKDPFALVGSACPPPSVGDLR